MILSRQNLVQFLRETRLLGIADNIFLVREIIKNRKSNRLFKKEHPHFPVPPYILAYDAYNHTNWQAYFEMGLKHSQLISDLIDKYVQANEIRVCEWGCGPARVIRHLEKIPGIDKIQLYGTDYSRRSIKWCQNNLKHINFFLNDLGPPLRVENNYFDCIYALSVFTHLSEKMHYAWIEELYRKLNSNGILIITTHGDDSAKRLLPKERDKYNSGNLVVKDKITEGKKHFLSYQPQEFVKNKLLRKYDILEHLNSAVEYQMHQEVWVAKKRSS